MTDSDAGKNGIYDEKIFEKAFHGFLQMDKKDYPSYIGGFMVASGTDYRIFSPIDGSICFGNFQEPEPGATATAAEAAEKAFAKWSAVSPADRKAVISKALEIFRVQRYRLAAAVLVSSGMTPKESMAEVDALISIMDAACSSAVSGKPVGPWAIITAHNSPLASPVGHAAAAMAAGNTVVVMPSKYTPIPVYMAYDIFVQAGLPEGVFNLIVDRKDRSQIDLSNDSRITGIVASGSGKNMEDMMFLQVDDELSFVNEIKGMNPILIYRPGDMKKVSRDVLDSAFRYSGQHLYSTSKVIITIDDQKKFVDTILEQVKELVITDPAEAGTFSGPIISGENAAFFEETLQRVAGSVLYGGKRIASELTQEGYYYTPAIITGLDDEEDLAYMDSGFPILYIKIVSGLDEAFEELAYTECGLSAGIYSKDQKAIDRFKTEADLPAIFVNESSRSLPPGLSAKTENFVR